MKARTLCVAWLAAGLVCGPLAAAQNYQRHSDDEATEQASVPEAASSSADAPIFPDGTWGVGLGYLPGSAETVPNVTIPTVAGDLWLADGRFALEGALGFGTFEGIPEGTDGNLDAENSAANDFGLAGGARYVIARPSRYLLVEGIGRLDYTNEYAVTPVKGTEVGEQNGTFGLYLGAGLEVFLPFLSNVSLSVDTGLNALFTGTTGIGAGPSFSQTLVYLGGSGLGLPFTFSIHAYF